MEVLLNYELKMISLKDILKSESIYIDIPTNRNIHYLNADVKAHSFNAHYLSVVFLVIF